MSKLIPFNEHHRIPGKSSILYALFLLLMFEPMSLFYLEMESGFFAFIDAIWKVLSFCASGVVVYSLWSKGAPSKWAYPIILLCLLNAASVAINEGFVRFILQSRTLLGFIALAWFLHDRIRCDKDRLLDGLLIMLLFYTICGFLSIAITREVGMVPGTRTPVYFFGQKNMIFIYGIPLIAVSALRDFAKGSSISNTTIAAAVLYCFVSLYIDSASSVVCFAAIAGAFICLKLINRSFRLFHPAVFVCLIVVLFVVTTIQQENSGFIRAALDLLGRSPTFSGRIPAWEQAIQYFIESPLIGKGENLVYTLAYGVKVSSAHSFYLASLAQYGILYTAVLVADILLVGRAIARRPSVLVYAESVIFFVLLIHSVYDIMYLSNYIMIRALVAFSLVFFDEKRIDGYASI